MTENERIDANPTRRIGPKNDPKASRSEENGASVTGPAGSDKEGTDSVEGTESDTQSTRVRFWLTNDLLALAMNVSLVAVVAAGGAGLLELSAVPLEMRLTYLTIAGGSAVWTFGQPAFETWRENGRSP